MKDNFIKTKLDSPTLIHSMAQAARQVSQQIAQTSSADKNTALLAMAQQVKTQSGYIVAQNNKDIEAATTKQLNPALLDRLKLNTERIHAMTEGVHQIARLPDPVGEITDMRYQPNGLQIGKMRVPLGVIGIIYESRPNVTIDAAALCFKAGNAVILRGGSEAIHSNMAIIKCIHKGLEQVGLPTTMVQIISSTDRDAVGTLISDQANIDIIIPRGGRSLIERISREATVPVIKHLEGICHVYIDDDADLDKALKVAYNAKARRYGICGAMETLLVAHQVAKHILPKLCERYLAKGIELRGCKISRQIVAQMKQATELDWVTEYLDAVLSIRVVDGLEQAIEHINGYGSHHTDAIITENLSHSQRFIREVDSSSVMVNASTQFADGFEYGLGAEIGISTNKLHVRGPVGLEGLTCQKYIVIGNGHVRN